jgi:TPR repeat protein
MVLLSIMYRLGLGFSKDCALSRDWMEQAAKAGSTAAKYRLSVAGQDSLCPW